MMTAYTVTFPGLWITADRFEQALHQNPIYSFSKSTEVTFHFLSSCTIMVDAAVRLLSLANQLLSEEVPVTLVFDDEHNDAMPYLNRANFFTLLSQQVRVLPAWSDPSMPRRLHGHSNWRIAFAHRDRGSAKIRAYDTDGVYGTAAPTLSEIIQDIDLEQTYPSVAAIRTEMAEQCSRDERGEFTIQITEIVRLAIQASNGKMIQG
jgi:hypothetical protein